MKRILKKAVFAIGVLAVITGAILLVRHRKSELANMPQPAAPTMVVHVQTAEPGKLTTSEHYLGTIEAVSMAMISPRVTGHLQSVKKDVGDRAVAGEVMARLDDRELLQQKRALEAELDGARSDLEEKKEQFKRRRQLFQKNHIPEESRDSARRAYLSAQANVRRLEAEVESATISLEYAVINAPFDGIITKRQQDAGDLAMPGHPVFTIEQPSAGYKVLVKIPQETAGHMAPDAKAVLQSGNRTIEAAVDRVYPAMERQGLATVELRLKEAPFSLPSGATVGVDLVTGHAAGIRVSNRAVLEHDANAYIFKVSNKDQVEKTEVEVLGRHKEHAVIDGQVTVGERLIVGDESMLIQIGNGTRIRPVGNGNSL